MTTATQIKTECKIEWMTKQVQNWNGKGKCPVCKNKAIIACPCGTTDECRYCEGDPTGIVCPCDDPANLSENWGEGQ